MLGTLVLTAFYLLAPVLLILLCEKYKLFQKIGVVLLAYAVGLIVGNIGFTGYFEHSAKVQDTLNSFTILLAIPLLLFSIDIRKWFKEAGKAALALVVLLFSVVFSVIIGYFLFKNGIDDAWKIAGMLMGVYSGGTPNMAAIQVMLDVKPETFIMVNTLDIIVSSAYLLFLMTIGKYFFRKILPKYNDGKDESEALEFDETQYEGILKRKSMISLLKALGFTIIIVGASLGLSFLITQKISMLVLILAITTLSILASLSPKVNQIKYTFQAGMFFIIVFCMVVASMADVKNLEVNALQIFKFISVVVFGALIIKTILSKIFKIDADTLIVASTALICSPPFVPVMAGVLKNKTIIVTGLTIGIIGYAVGNYLGVTLAYILKMF